MHSFPLVIFEQNVITIISFQPLKVLINKAIFDFTYFHRYMNKPTKELVIPKTDTAIG